jgi:hypothetical protein
MRSGQTLGARAPWLGACRAGLGSEPLTMRDSSLATVSGSANFD